MSQPLAAAIAFFAFGALFLGSILLLLFNPRSRGVRWFVLFQLANMLWLAVQGWGILTVGFPRNEALLAATVHMLPALFLAYTLVEALGRPDRDGIFVIMLGAGLHLVGTTWLPIEIAGVMTATWHISAWGMGAILLTRFLRGRGRPAGDSAGSHRWLNSLVTGLMVVVAPAVLISVLVFGSVTFIYAMPLLVVWIQVLVFVGVSHLRYYDIEVRAARTGELATSAAEAERAATMGELTASLAHEIRNPLTGVRSLAQRLADEDIDEERRRRYAGVILEETARVERLVSNLLGLTRRPPPGRPLETTRLAPLFEDLLLLLSTRANRAGVSLVVDSPAADAAVPREPLAQALLNLVLNAIAHTPPGGTIRLAAGMRNGVLEIRVSDSGHGVPPAERERIWEPFHSTSGGTGLGLAVVRRLAREHGWALGVGDAPGGGAEFRIEIPMQPGAPTATAVTTAAETPAKVRPER